MIKKTIEEAHDWLLENRVDEYGNLCLDELDFSDFDGDVYLGHMKVKYSLCRQDCEVGYDLSQGWNKVVGNFYSRGNQVGGEAYITEPTQLLKEISVEELAKMGYKLKEDK